MVSDDLHNWLIYAPPNSPKSCNPLSSLCAVAQDP